MITKNINTDEQANWWLLKTSINVQNKQID